MIDKIYEHSSGKSPTAEGEYIMEDIKLEQVQAQPQTETVEPVSTDEVKEEQEWVPPKTKEELDKLLKAAENRTYTRALKELDVTSVKAFKEYRTKLEQDRDTLIKEKDEYVGKYDNLVKEYTTLKQERILDKLNVQDEYRDDLVKLASEKATEDKPFEAVLKDMVEGKYKYTVADRNPIKMGAEKTEKVDQENTISDALKKKFPWLKD